MTIIAKFDAEREILYTRVTGMVTYADLVEHLRETRQRLPGARELLDASAAVTDLTGEQVRSLVRIATELFERGALGPTAVVATDDGLFGMSRMYEGVAADRAGPVYITREITMAERWLTTQAPTHPHADGDSLAPSAS